MLTNYNTGVIWPIEFGCTLFVDQLVIPNFYSIKLCIVPNSDSTDFTDGLRKIRYFVDGFLHNSIFISYANPAINLRDTIETNLVVFPEEPYDYTAGSVILQKFSSISKKYFDIEYLLIDSLIGDKIQYCIVDSSETGLDTDGEFWWNQDTAHSGGAIQESWEKLDIGDLPKFNPKIIKGGRSEN